MAPSQALVRVGVGVVAWVDGLRHPAMAVATANAASTSLSAMNSFVYGQSSALGHHSVSAALPNHAMAARPAIRTPRETPRRVTARLTSPGSAPMAGARVAMDSN